MSVVEWIETAQDDYADFLRWLDEHSPPAAGRAETYVEKTLADLSLRPYRGHRSMRWSELLEWSATDFNKIIVYRVLPMGIRVVAFLDTRQDLDGIDLSFE